MKAVLGQEGETGKLAGRLNYKGQITLALVAVLALAVAISLFFAVRDYVRELGVAQQDQASGGRPSSRSNFSSCPLR